MNEQDLLDRMKRLWRRSDQIFFEFLKPEALLKKPIELRNPFIFYVGHVAAFSYIHVNLKVCKEESFMSEFDAMFERGIDPDVMDPTKVHAHSICPANADDWPCLQRIQDYVAECRSRVLKAYASVSESNNNPWLTRRRVFNMVMEHEAMHQETLMYMIQQLEPPFKNEPAGILLPLTQSSQRQLQKRKIHIPSGTVVMGAVFDEVPFGWDNEFPQHSVHVPAFAIDSLNVTNSEYLQFVQSGEYSNPIYWRPEDWKWKEKLGLQHPLFWKRHHDGARTHYTFQLVFGEEIPLDDVADWPVLVSWAEAMAYAKWKRQTLPTEAQYCRAAYTEPFSQRQRLYPWGDAAPTPQHCNTNWTHFSPTSVGTHPAGSSAWGVHDLIGDAWEWTRTPFGPFDGFVPMSNYPGYSADFFEGKHFVLKGGSWCTDNSLLRPSFRNWYQDRYPYMYAKFRLVSEI
jgi:iron(II)-dependent oxidoreductase